jgi:hypothetical protein
VVDTGQHVFLRCCTAYRGLLARMGMTGSVRIQDRFDVTVLSPGGRARLRRNGLPGPLHMGATLARYPMLSLAERARVTRAALAMRMLNPADPALDSQRLGDWLAAHGQDERTRRVLWDLFTVSSLNIDGDDASLALAATVVKTALLGKKDAADIGVPLAPLGELHGTAGLALLRRLGADVRLGVKAAAVEQTGGEYLVRLARGEGESDGDEGPDTRGTIAADGVVLATPAYTAAKLTGGSPGCRSRRPWTRPCSGCSTGPRFPGSARAAAGSTSRCRCRRRNRTWTCPRPGCGRCLCRRWPGCCPARGTRGSANSLSPGSGGRRSARVRDAGGCGRKRPPRCPA